MSGAAAARAVRTRRAARERWDTPPRANSHLVRYCVHAQDPLARKPNVRAMYNIGKTKARWIDKERKLVEASISDWTLWMGDCLGKANAGQSDIASEPMPRSTVVYWLELLITLHLFERYDLETQKPRGPRTRGDGRHKSWWVINSFDRALDLICADPNVAIPKNRCFWTLDSWPISTETAVERKLDIAIAERYPEAWANNARALNPRAAMKPLRRTETRQATADEVKAIQDVLTGEPWKIAATGEQARERIQWAREVTGAEAIPAEWIAAAMGRQLEGILRRYRQQHRYAPDPVHNVNLFARQTMHGLAEVWNREQAGRRTEEGFRVAPEPVHDGTDPDPPPPVEIPRKPFPTR